MDSINGIEEGHTNHALAAQLLAALEAAEVGVYGWVVTANEYDRSELVVEPNYEDADGIFVAVAPVSDMVAEVRRSFGF
jgi:hypothetical protein